MSPLAAPPKRAFTSKFANPNDNTNKSPISLATGGLVPYNTTWRGEARNGGERGVRRNIADVGSFLSLPQCHDSIVLNEVFCGIESVVFDHRQHALRRRHEPCGEYHGHRCHH